ncbi:MAG: helix-turn-helix domain-containing protein [Thermoanaerobaculia bacterium]|jgi:transcriptional regulator GlxA family with amidase domain
MAKQTTSRVAVLLHEKVSLSIALLMRDILERTNQLVGRACFAVRLVGRPGLRAVTVGPVSVRVSRVTGRVDDLVVPPYAPGSDPFVDRPEEARLIERLHRNGATVHAACLGSLLVAQTGLLAGRDAATHWAWVQRAAQAFPDVSWDPGRMICDTGDVVTSGGFLAAVDLSLALVERVCSRSVSREAGRLLLADSIRQRQSVYATTLVPARVDDPRMQRLEAWIESHLSSAVTVEEMAEVCQLGPRTFHREFVKAWGFTPKKYVQLKRIEKVRLLLRNADLSIEEAVARVGVSDVPSFRRIFQRELGLSPAEYRRRLRAEG